MSGEERSCGHHQGELRRQNAVPPACESSNFVANLGLANASETVSVLYNRELAMPLDSEFQNLGVEFFAEPNCRTRRIDERPLILIDGLFRPDFINLFDHFLKGLAFSLADYDAENSRHVLHWIHEFSLTEVMTHSLLSFVYSQIKGTAEKLCPASEMRLERVHCNTSLYGDLQFPHYDLTPGVTWLYYSNPVWESNWMGETIFYDFQEPIYAVFPKPGRVVVFAADILHRGGVPSRECVEARRSLAFKFRTECNSKL
jgi:hypothetical protein